MNILAIDTATETLSIAISQSGKITKTMDVTTKNDHATHLMPAIAKVMKWVKLVPEDLDEIIVGNGPGSYTGTRIGITTAKTMAWSLGIPIQSISSLKAIALSAKMNAKLICPFIDARRNAVYFGIYKSYETNLLNKIKDDHLTIEKLLNQLDEIEEEIHFVSPHMEKYQSIISERLKRKAIIFPIKEMNSIAENLLKLYKQYDNVNVHNIVPNYVRKTEAEIKLEQRPKGE